MTLEATLGNPTENGIYAARQWYAWRILEWHDGAWWHVGRAAKWPTAAVGNLGEIEAHFGPLPVIAKICAPFDKPREPAPMEFDL